MPFDPINLARWRVSLGKPAEESVWKMAGYVGKPIMGGDQGELDEALESIYSSGNAS